MDLLNKIKKFLLQTKEKSLKDIIDETFILSKKKKEKISLDEAIRQILASQKIKKENKKLLIKELLLRKIPKEKIKTITKDQIIQVLSQIEKEPSKITLPLEIISGLEEKPEILKEKTLDEIVKTIRKGKIEMAEEQLRQLKETEKKEEIGKARLKEKIKIEKKPILSPEILEKISLPKEKLIEIKKPEVVKVQGLENFIKILLTILTEGKFNVAFDKNPMPIILEDEKLFKFLAQIRDTGGGGPAVVQLKSKHEVGDGAITVTTAGTRIQLPDKPCKRVYIQADEGNTGVIVVGSSTVVAASANRRGKAFYATQGDWFEVDNFNRLYIDATADNQKIQYYYEN